MTNEMIERVAKAIEVEMFKVTDINGIQGIVTPEQLAKTVIEAMREPTKEMVVAAGMPPNFAHTYVEYKSYQTMIDAALKE